MTKSAAQKKRDVDRFLAPPPAERERVMRRQHRSLCTSVGNQLRVAEAAAAMVDATDSEHRVVEEPRVLCRAVCGIEPRD